MFLRPLLLLPLALTGVIASPASVRRVEDSGLLVHYHHEQSSNQTELTLSTRDKKDIFGHGCESSLEVGGTSITLEVDEHGIGTIVVGDKTHRVVGNAKANGGVSCTKLYNDESVVIDCTIPWDGDMTKLTSASDNDLEECFANDAAVNRRGLPKIFSSPFNEKRSESGALEKRQRICSLFETTEAELEGDGSPYDDYLHKQAGASQECAQRATCFVGVGEEVSLTLTAEVGLNLGPWISGGFSVSHTTSASTERGCYGEAHDTVCQWSSTAHVAYKVAAVKKVMNPVTCDPYEVERSEPYWIKSPKDGNPTKWYCVLNTCRGDGDQYWEMDQ